MKRFLCTLFAFVIGFIAQAQTNFLQFINGVDWSLSETEFIEKYADKVQKGAHHHSEYFSTTSDYVVTGLILGDVECEATITVDSLSRRVKQLDIRFTGFEKNEDMLERSKHMDNILIPLFGRPDEVEEDLKNQNVTSLDRKWYLDNYNIRVSHMGFPTLGSSLYSLAVIGKVDNGPDFRHSKWGDSRQKVMAQEGRVSKYDDPQLYAFDDRLAGMSCVVAFIFTNNKLAMAKYLFKESHTNKNDYITDYHNLVELLTKKYGGPSYDTHRWKNSLYKNDPSDYGFAVSLGHLYYNAGWLNEDTTITVYLTGENYDIDLVIQYVSKKLEKAREQEREQESLDLL